MGLAIAGAYPTHLDMAKRIFRQKRQRRALTGRGETYEEGVAASEGAIRAGLASRERLLPYKLERERLTEQKRQFDIVGARQEERFETTFAQREKEFDVLTGQREEQMQREDEAAKAAGLGSLLAAGVSAAELLAPEAGWLNYLGVGGGGAAAATATAATTTAAVATFGAVGPTAAAEMASLGFTAANVAATTTAGTTAVAAGASTAGGFTAAASAAAAAALPFVAVAAAAAVALWGLYQLFSPQKLSSKELLARGMITQEEHDEQVRLRKIQEAEPYIYEPQYQPS